MSDEIKLTQAAQRGAQAEALLRNELLTEAFTALESDYIKAWASTEAGQSAARENYWKALQILADVRRHLVTAARDGRLAHVELNQIAAKFSA